MRLFEVCCGGVRARGSFDMRELSLNILDIVENSVKAGASLVEIEITAKGNRLKITVKDNGCGMSADFLKKVTDPFTTTRTTRKVGMGIPLFKMAAEQTGGSFEITSEVGKGTAVTADFVADSIDRAPLGDLGSTMATLLAAGEGTEFKLTVTGEKEVFIFDTSELKAELDGVPVSEPEVLSFVKEMINENTNIASGGL